MEKILVTGATGQLGHAVVKVLAEQGKQVRAAARQIEKLTTVESAPLDYDKVSTFEAALQDVSKVFLIAPAMDREAPAKLIPFIDAAKMAGVQHVVFNSAFGMDAVEDAPLRVIEKYLMGTGIAYTILRPNFFMNNFTTGFIAPMIEAGTIYLAAGDGKTSFISTADIATVGAAAFNNNLYGAELNLTGPEALDHAQAAAIISRITGKKVTYQPLAEEAMLQGARDQGMPEGAVWYLGFLYSAVRNGWAAAITDDVRKVTGNTPISFEDFLKKDTVAKV
jgi:uncharacterized protein YbjT (DUF2867 family)